ncbi:hypothetical protein OA416_01990 [Paracoccaceae bacterium]|nr:hypothetical protein [Paracoccaceae bacterium]
MLVLSKKSFSENADIDENDFIKLSLSPDNNLIPDLHNKLPGKSVWVPANKELIKYIQGREDVKAHFGVTHIFTDDLVFLIQKVLRKKILNGISLAKKAGYLAIGLDKIKTQLIEKKHCLIVVAKNAKSLKNYSFFSSDSISCFENLLSQRDLGGSTGKNNVKYVGILSKNFKKTIQVDLNKLKGFIETD